MSIGREGFVPERTLRSQPQHGLRPCRSGAGEAERSPALAGLTHVRRGLSRAISASFSADKSNESTRVRRGQSRTVSQLNFSLNRLCTSCGSAFPFISFITCPTRYIITPSFPFLNCSTIGGVSFIFLFFFF